ncbi:hypothetical protein GOODEAATRI_016822, partial [Goodea atripinnis]
RAKRFGWAQPLSWENTLEPSDVLQSIFSPTQSVDHERETIHKRLGPNYIPETSSYHCSEIIKASETTDIDMQIEKEKASFNISGGCTALMVACLQGKLYVGNAGDSRCDSHARTKQNVFAACVNCCLHFNQPYLCLIKQNFVCHSPSELSLYELGKSIPCQQSSRQSQKDSGCSFWYDRNKLLSSKHSTQI